MLTGGGAGQVDGAQYPREWDQCWVESPVGRIWCLVERPDLRSGVGPREYSPEELVRAKAVSVVGMMRVG